jgi:hypothetical protein
LKLEKGQAHVTLKNLNFVSTCKFPHVICYCFGGEKHGFFVTTRISRQGVRLQFACYLRKLGRRNILRYYFSFDQEAEKANDGQFFLKQPNFLPSKSEDTVEVFGHINLKDHL